MKTFQEDLDEFLKKYPYDTIDVDGVTYDYILTGAKNRPVLVGFNGLEMQEMWIKYAEELADEYGFLIFKYPLELKTNEEQARGLHKLLEKLSIQKPILCGASDGGIHAQKYIRMYPDEVSGLILATTVSLNSEYAKRFRKIKWMMPLMNFKLKHKKWESMKQQLITMAEGYFNDETAEEQAYGHTFFETIFATEAYRAQYIHSMVLLADMLGNDDFLPEEFATLDGKVLLLHPEKDIFSAEDQNALTSLFKNPEVHKMVGGHLAFVMRYPEYIELIRAFLSKLEV